MLCADPLLALRAGVIFDYLPEPFVYIVSHELCGNLICFFRERTQIG